MSEKYVYTGGPYRQFHGYVFAYGKPVEIRDYATLQAIRLAHDFVRVEDFVQPEPEQKAAPAPQPVAEPAPVVAAENACPKCGKALKRQGAHFHIRKCKG